MWRSQARGHGRRAAGGSRPRTGAARARPPRTPSPQHAVVIAPRGIEAVHPPPDPSHTRSNPVMEDWLSGKSPATIKIYRAAVAKLQGFLRARDRPSDIQSVTDCDISFAFRAYLATPAQGLARNSQTTHLRAIKSMLAFATDCGLIDSNPAAFLTDLKSTCAVVERNLSCMEVDQFLEALAPGRDRFAGEDDVHSWASHWGSR